MSEGGGALLDQLSGPCRALSLLESARVVGGLRWVELGAFASLGRAATSGGLPPELAVWASGASLAHAWRAGQLHSLLPVSAGLPSAAEATKPPGEDVAELVESLAPPSAATGSPSSGDGPALFRLYAALTAAYERRAEFAHPSADPPAVRVFVRLAADTRRIAASFPASTGPAGPSPGGDA